MEKASDKYVKDAISDNAEELCRQLQNRLEGLSKIGGKLERQNKSKMSLMIQKKLKKAIFAFDLYITGKVISEFNFEQLIINLRCKILEDIVGFRLNLKPGLHEPQLHVEWSFTFFYSLVVERRC